MSGSPDFERAVVDQTKIVEYLLGTSGPASIAKARFFGSLGYSGSRWEDLAKALRAQARDATLNTKATAWGRKHLAFGDIARRTAGGTRSFRFGLKRVTGYGSSPLTPRQRENNDC